MTSKPVAALLAAEHRPLPHLTSHILRFGAYATEELHIPPDVFDPALDEVDFGGEQPATPQQGTVTQQRVV